MAKVTVLPNGLRLITRHKKEAASASLAIWIGVGSRYETRNQNGIYHLVEHLLFQGTSKRQSAKEISEAIEGIGGLLNAFTGQECTCYLTKVPAYRLDQALEVLSDLVLNPLFRLADFEKERRVVVEEIKMHQDQPGDRAEMSLFELLFPRHPLGADIAGNSKSLQNMELARVQEAWQAKYVARNMVVSITGAIDSSAVEKKDRAIFRPLGGRPSTAVPCLQRQGAKSFSGRAKGYGRDSYLPRWNHSWPVSRRALCLGYLECRHRSRRILPPLSRNP